MKKTKEIENVREYIMNEDEEYRLMYFSKDEIEREETILGIPFVWVHGMPALDLKVLNRKVDKRRAFLVQKQGDTPDKAATMLQVARDVKKGLLSQNEGAREGTDIKFREDNPYLNLSHRKY